MNQALISMLLGGAQQPAQKVTPTDKPVDPAPSLEAVLAKMTPDQQRNHMRIMAEYLRAGPRPLTVQP